MKHSLLKTFGAWTLTPLALVGLASVSHALTLDNIEHFSDAGGVWNNTSPNNWAIWVSTNSDPNTNDPRPFLNEPNPLNNPISFPESGTFTYTLYKNNYGSIDQRTLFHFTHGTASGTLTVEPNSAYLATNGPVPATPGTSIELDGLTVSINSFGWYDETVFGKDVVGQQQNLGPGGGLDHIAVATFNVVPEPASAMSLAVTAALALARRRRG